MEVIVDVPALWDKPFTYSCPLNLPRGAKVRVPLGRKVADGFVLGPSQTVPRFQIKEIKGVYDLRAVPSPELLKLGEMVAEHYCAPVSSVWSCLWPSSLRPRSTKKPGEHLSGVPKMSANVGNACMRRPILVVGSEVHRYLVFKEMVKDALSSGLNVLVLVPERRSMKRMLAALELADDLKVACLDSNLPGSKRNNLHLLTSTGEVRVAVGSRSAVFADIPRLGLIIVDEEESDSYKSLDYPFIDARTVATIRSQALGIQLVLGSSNPRVTTYHYGETGAIEIMSVDPDHPIDKRRVLLLDESKKSSREVISSLLGGLIRTHILKGDKVVILVGRKGDARYVVCQDCGRAVECNRCGVSMTLYAKKNAVVCPVCGASRDAPLECPNCGGINWRLSGYGIDALRKELASLIPSAPLYKIDSGIGDDEADALVREFSESRGSCLVATQALLGHGRLTGVGLTCVVSFDSILMAPDYLSRERGYHLLSRLKAMTASCDGNGIFGVETRNRSHPVFSALTDSRSFYRQELEIRSALGYPPFGHYYRIVVSGKNPMKTEESAKQLVRALAGQGSIEVLGPAPVRGNSPKAAGYQIALKSRDEDLLRKVAFQEIKAAMISGLSVSLDVEPSEMA